MTMEARMDGTLEQRLLWRIEALKEALSDIETMRDAISHQIARNALLVDNGNAKLCEATLSQTRDGAEGAGQTLVEQIIEADALPPEASFDNAPDMLNYLNDAPPNPVPSLDTNSVADSTGEKTGTHGASKEAGGHSRGDLTPVSTLSEKPAPDAMREALQDAMLHLEGAQSGFISGCGSDTAWLNKRDEIVNAATVALSAPVPPADGSEEIRWQRVNGEPFEYAIQQGPHGDEFVKLFNGKCLRRALPIQPGAGERGGDAAEADRFFEMAGEFGNQLQTLAGVVQDAIDLLTERKHGNAARSPGHNARVILEAALKSVSPSALRQPPPSSSEGGR